jgi:predicted N-acetyltransferase YhbS
MLIRPARPDEAELLTGIALRAKAYWGYDEAFMAACREELTVDAAVIERASTFTVVAEDDGRVRGFAVLAAAPPSGELAMLFVEPDRIGRGITPTRTPSRSTWRWAPPASAARRPSRSPGVNSR